jgi:hypothetical protein
MGDEAHVVVHKDYGLGEVKAEGWIAVAVGLWAVFATWAVDRREEALLAWIEKGLAQVFALLGRAVGHS